MVEDKKRKESDQERSKRQEPISEPDFDSLLMYLKVGPHVRSEQRVNVADPLAFHFVGHINRLEHPERPHEQHCLHVSSSSHGTSFRDLESGLFFPASHFDLSLIVISTFHCIFCVCRI